MLVFDTETRTDAAQALTFGSYRFYMEDGRCLEEGLFYADDLPRTDRDVLEAYTRKRRADSDRRLGKPQLLLLTRRKFLDKFYTAAYDARSLLVGFNLPFDLSRISCEAGNARGRFAGGFSLALWDYLSKNGDRKINNHRPRIAIKHIDSKRALKGFTRTMNPDREDLIPEGSTTGEPDESYGFRGHFLDLRTLAFVLTDRGYSLASACEAFGVEHGKGTVERHGVVTPEYIDYNRQDVLATAELAEKLIAEYDRFEVDLQETQAYSPASLGKAHLRKMGIAPVLARQPKFPKRLSRVHGVRLFRWSHQCPHPQGSRSGRLYGLSLDVPHREYPDGSLEVRGRRGDRRGLYVGLGNDPFSRRDFGGDALSPGDVDETSRVCPRDSPGRHLAHACKVQPGKQRLSGCDQPSACDQRRS
jgi:hypothetical protein